MRISRDQWPKDWEIQPLGQLCTVVIGKTPPRGRSEYWGGGNIWVTISDMVDRTIIDSKEYITDLAIQAGYGKVIPIGTLLMSFKLTIGKLAFAGKDLLTNEAIAALIIKDEYKDQINPEYLYWTLKIIPLEEEAILAVKGRTINKEKIERINVPFPNKAVQDQIVNRIQLMTSELGEARQLHEKIVIDTNRLMVAVLADYFPKFKEALPLGWEWRPISSLAQDTSRKNPAQTFPTQYFNYIDISSVDNRIGVVTNPKTVMGKDAPSRARKLVHTNDVIFATTRPYLKNVALIPAELDNSICSTGFCVLVPKPNNCVPQYLFYAARSESIIQQLIPKQRGASYPAVKDQDIFSANIPIPYPDDPERSKTTQEMIAKRVSAMEVSISETQKDNAKTKLILDQLEQSILVQAFRGEL